MDYTEALIAGLLLYGIATTIGLFWVWLDARHRTNKFDELLADQKLESKTWRHAWLDMVSDNRELTRQLSVEKQRKY